MNGVQSLVDLLDPALPFLQTARHGEEYSIDIIAPSRQLMLYLSDSLRILRVYLLHNFRQKPSLIIQCSLLRLLIYKSLHVLLLSHYLHNLFNPSERDIRSIEDLLDE